MGHAQRESIQDRNSVSADTDLDNTLDEATVLEHLETNLIDDEDHCRITGIGNGAVIGALVWIFVIGAVVIAWP